MSTKKENLIIYNVTLEIKLLHNKEKKESYYKRY